jgi:membrane fusion protein (multidrug efflux system)
MTKKTNTKFIIIISSLVLLGVTYGTYSIFTHFLEGTDDAQIEKNMNPIIPEYQAM